MSVLACDRRQCKNIMCDRLILDGEDESYICNECWRELVEYRGTWPDQMKASNVRKRIIAFMQTKPGTSRELTTYTAIQNEFDRLTHQRREDE